MSLGIGLKNKIRRSRAGGFTGLLDQSFATGATAAYSLRLLRSKYTGAAVRVREDSGNTETDIGFSGGTLDETALFNHVGSNNGFVTKWYDQSGNGNDASNSTASEQPKIVSSGTVIKENGKPTIEFDGSDDFLNVGTGVYSVDESVVNHFAVAYLRNLSSNNTYLIGTKAKDSGYLHIYDNNNGEFRIVTFRQSFSIGIGSSVTNLQHLAYMLADRQSLQGYLNGSIDVNVSDVNANFDGNHVILGASNDNGDNPFEGNCQEIIFYTKDQSSNRTKIETNINNHYSIF